MKAVILDSAKPDDTTGQAVQGVLESALQSQGWDVDHFVLCDSKIGNCAGDFFCWVKTPGTCNVNDDNRVIAQALAGSDLMVYLSPVTFGGYSSVLKGMVDHQIQNVSPHFKKIDGEIHHEKRYQKNPDLLVVGWLDEGDDHSEALFRHLAQRNALNLHARIWISDVLVGEQTRLGLEARASGWLTSLEKGQSSPLAELPSADPQNIDGRQVQQALLLVGSPKTRKSTSVSLGGYLYQQLEKQGVHTKTIYLYTVLSSPRRWLALLDALDAADLVTLAFPIYVDTLPAPVIRALERLAAHRQDRGQTRRQLFTAIANCGLPEVEHTRQGLANCQVFASQSDFIWAGSLALGKGEIINGVPLVEGGGMTMKIRQGLDLAALAMARGEGIPEEASNMVAKPIVPHWLYRIMGWWRTRRWAKSHGAQRLLKQRPYAESY